MSWLSPPPSLLLSWVPPTHPRCEGLGRRGCAGSFQPEDVGTSAVTGLFGWWGGGEAGLRGPEASGSCAELPGSLPTPYSPRTSSDEEQTV